jgi:hypothetical protein
MNEPHHNAQWLADLPEDQRQIVERGAEAIEAVKLTFEHRMAIGHGLKVLKAKAEQLKVRNAFRLLAEQAGYGGLFRSAGGKVTHSFVSHLLDIVDNEAKVREWREQLTEHQRWAWASPSSIKSRCPVFKKTEQTEQTEQAKKKADTAPSVFEVAVAALHDHLKKEDDADNRHVAIEQIIEPFADEVVEVLVADLLSEPIETRVAAVRQLMVNLDLTIDDIAQELDKPEEIPKEEAPQVARPRGAKKKSSLQDSQV